MTDAPAETTTPPGTGDAPAKTGDTTGEPAKPPETATNGQPPPAPKPPERPAVPDSDDSKLEKNAAYYARHPEELVAVVNRAQEINPDAFTEKAVTPGKSEADFNEALAAMQLQNKATQLDNKMELAYRDAAIKYPDISVEDVKMMRADSPEQAEANAKYLSERFEFERVKGKAPDTTTGDDPAKPGHLTKDPADSSVRLDKEISVDKGGIRLPTLSGDPKSALDESRARLETVLNEMDINDLTRNE